MLGRDKSLEKKDVSVAPNFFKIEEKRFSLESQMRDFFNKDKMFKRKRFHKVFEWTKRQLADLPEKLYPDDKGRVVRFEFKKKDSMQICGYDCSYAVIFATFLSIISIIIGIFLKCQ